MKKLLLLSGLCLTALLIQINIQAQNIFSGEPVQVVGQMNGYSTASSSNSSYRRVSVSSGTPTDGRGQWVKTYNVQSSGGDFTPINMSGGGGNGFLFISGPSGNRFANKWVFSGTSQGSVNAINNISAFNSGNDMGLNMNTAGRYTFVFNDAGYTTTNAKYYVAYTSAAPVSLSRSSQTLAFDRSATIAITTGATPSTGENVFVRYTTGADFASTGSSSVVQATGSSTSWSATIPAQAIGSTVRYYVFTSTIALATLNSMSEIDKSLSVINYDDNSSSNYTYTLTSSFTSTQTGNFNASSTWGNNQPFDGASYTIENTHNVTLNVSASVSGIIINQGGTFIGSDGTSRTITINTGGSFTNNSSASGGYSATSNGIVSFAGTATIGGTQATTFNNLQLNGATTLATTPFISGNLQLNSGYSFVSGSISYTNTSKLIYNSGGTPSISNEWTGNGTTSGIGIPQDIDIQNGTTLSLSAITSSRGIAGNLTLGAGSTSGSLTMGSNSVGTARLVINGNIVIGGNTSGGTSTLQLSDNGSSPGIDVGGNWTRTAQGSFDGSGGTRTRGVFFIGSNNSTITSNTTAQFAFLIINKTSSTNTVTLSNAVTVNNGLTLTSGKIILGNNNLTVPAAIGGSPDASNYIVTDGTGSLIGNGVTTARLFPVGISTTSYSPITITTGTSSNYTVRVSNTLPCTPLGDANKVVNLAWFVTSSNATPTTLLFQWPSGAAAGGLNNTGTFDMARYTTACPYTVQAGVGTGTGSGPYTLSVTSGIASGTSTIQYVIGNTDAFAVPESTADFRTNGNVNFTTNTNWQYYNGASWVSASSAPSSTNNVSILSTHTATLDAGFTVGASKTFTLNGGTLVIGTGSNILSGSGNFTFTSGTLQVTHANGISGGITTSGTNTFTSGTITFNAGTAQNFGTITALSGMDITTSGSSTNVTLNSSPTINSLTIGTSSTFTGSDASARTLTITRSVSATTITNNGTWANGTGGSTVVFTGAPSSGNATHTTSGTIGFQSVTINRTGGTDFMGITFGAGATVAGTLEIGSGGFIASAYPSSFFGPDAIVKFNTGGTYNVGVTDNTWPSSGSLPPNIEITSTTVNLNAVRTAAGNLNITGGGLTLNANLIINGNWTRSGGSFTPNTSKVTLSGSTAQTVNVSSGDTMYDLEVNNAAGVTFSTGGLTINNSGTLTLTAGLLSFGTNHNLTIGSTSAGICTIVRSAGSLSFAGTGAVVATAANIDITYSNTADISTGAEFSTENNKIRNVSVSSTTGRTVTLANANTVNGNLTIGSGVTLADGGFALTVKGNVTNSGTHSGAGEILLNSTTANQTITGGIFGNIEVAKGTGTDDNRLIFNNSALTVNGDFVITTGWVTAGTHTNITLGGTGKSIVTNGTLFAEYSNQTIQFTIDGSYTLSGSNFLDARRITINAGKTLDAGTAQLNCNNNGVISGAPAVGVIINGTLKTARTQGLSGSDNAAIRSSFGTPTLGASSTIEYNKADGGQTITALTYNTLTLSNTSGTQTASAAVTATRINLTSGGVFNLGSFTHTSTTLYLNNSGVINGSWGSSSSSATYKNDSYFSGSGVLNVSTSNCTNPAAATAGNATKDYTGVANTTAITATVGSGETADWYDAATSGTLLLSGNTSYTPSAPINSGVYTYYALARNTTTNCISTSRTAVTLTINSVSISSADFRSKATGNFSDFANVWEYDNGGSWVAATQVPGTGNNVAVLNTHTITQNADFTVGASKTLVLNSGNTGNGWIIAPDKTLTITGTANFNGNNVIVKSDATGTGAIGTIGNNGANLTGATNVTVERYIPGSRTWKALAAPLTGTTNNSIFYQWQNNGQNITGQGVLLWSPSGTGVNGNGLASIPQGGNTNILTYNNVGNNYSPVTDTKNTPLFNGSGPIPYLIFVTDDYNSTGSGNIFPPGDTATTLRATGSLFTGTYSRTGLAAGWHMIPNPYQSPLNILNISFNNLVTADNNKLRFWIWDPKFGGGVGNYQYLDPELGVFDGGGSYGDAGLGSTDWEDSFKLIPPGGAFWIRVGSGGEGSLTITESAKNAAGGVSLFGRTQTAPYEFLRIGLLSGNNSIKSSVGVVFKAGETIDITDKDVPKISIGSESMSVRRKNNNLTIEYRPLVTTTDTVFLRLNNTLQTNYQFKIRGRDFDLSQGLTAILQDLYLNTETSLTLTDMNTINFTVDANAASAGDRFRIIFRTGVVTSVPDNNALKGLKFYPNPVVSGAALVVDLKNMAPDSYHYRLYNAVGVQLFNGVLQHNGGSSLQRITVPEHVAAGVYMLEFTNSKGNKRIHKITIQ